MISDDHSRGGKLIEGVDGEVDGSKGVLMGMMSPLEEMITSEKEGGTNVSLIKGREGTIVGTMD